jgi:signal transduction histidine kinase
VGAIDALLERIYRRLGVWVLAANIVVTFSALVPLSVVAVVFLARMEALSSADAMKMFAASALMLICVGSAATLGALRSARPLTAWLAGPRDATGAEAAWRVALRVPEISGRWSAACFLPLTPPHVLALAMIGSIDFAGAVAIAVVDLFALVVAATGAMSLGQLATRPLVEDVARSVRGPAVRPDGFGMRTKFLLLIPASLVTATALGVFLAAEPGSGAGHTLPDLAIAIPAIIVFAVPVALLVAYSTIQPLEDVLRATERLKRGDFSTRVPELSADEAGTLARSFNQAMVGLAERERLSHENENLLEEVRASRARIVAASDAERRRVERNIHDGAQQQLVALALKLRALEERVGGDEQSRAAVAEAGDRLKSALQELRELARGLHPSILTTDGLPPALEQLAARAPLPVAISAPEERFSEAIESTAYFVVCEALANVDKYAQATCAQVAVERRNGRLVVEISDDGVGGAHAELGSGLAGLADRVAALDGRLTVESPNGQGTKIVAELPL